MRSTSKFWVLALLLVALLLSFSSIAVSDDELEESENSNEQQDRPEELNLKAISDEEHRENVAFHHYATENSVNSDDHEDYLVKGDYHVSKNDQAPVKEKQSWFDHYNYERYKNYLGHKAAPPKPQNDDEDTKASKTHHHDPKDYKNKLANAAGEVTMDNGFYRVKQDRHDEDFEEDYGKDVVDFEDEDERKAYEQEMKLKGWLASNRAFAKHVGQKEELDKARKDKKRRREEAELVPEHCRSESKCRIPRVAEYCHTEVAACKHTLLTPQCKKSSLMRLQAVMGKEKLSDIREETINRFYVFMDAECIREKEYKQERSSIESEVAELAAFKNLTDTARNELLKEKLKTLKAKKALLKGSDNDKKFREELEKYLKGRWIAKDRHQGALGVIIRDKDYTELNCRKGDLCGHEKFAEYCLSLFSCSFDRLSINCQDRARSLLESFAIAIKKVSFISEVDMQEFIQMAESNCQNGSSDRNSLHTPFLPRTPEQEEVHNTRKETAKLEKQLERDLAANKK